MRPTRSRRRQFETIVLLEARRLMSTSVADLASQEQVIEAPPPILANLTTPANNSVKLSTYFTDPNIPGSVVEFATTQGTFDVALTDAATPLTVANFLTYVNSGAYSGSFFHRSVVLANSSGGSPTNPADIVQGGGYNLSNGITHITTNAPVDNEVTTEQLDNVAGTIAMAKTSDPNSATSEFFFNIHDNSDLDSTSNSGGFTTFGHVLGGNGSSFPVIDTIAALPTVSIGTSLTTVPVQGLTEAQASSGSPPVTASNLVFINTASAFAGTTYTVTSSNPTLVNPTLTNGTVSFNYATTQTGTALITVVAKNVDGTSATSAFSVTVPGSSNTSSGPVLSTVTSAPITDGTTGTVFPLSNDTDSAAALNSSTVAIVTQPSHGTATFNSSSGLITYTPVTGFSGTDTLTYTVQDTNGTTSSAGTVNLDVVPGPVQITIGTKTARTLTFTEPTGQTGVLSVTNGTAVVTFGSYQVTTTTAHGNISAVGAGADITSIVFTPIKTRTGFISIKSSAAVTVGSFTSQTAISEIYAPTTTFTGTISVGSGNGGGLGVLDVGGLSGANLAFSGPAGRGTVILAPTVVNTNLDLGAIAEIKSTSWTITDGGSERISAKYIGYLDVTGSFAEPLSLTGTGYDLVNAYVTAPSAAWNMDGSIYRATITKPTAAWNVSVGGIVQRLAITGTLASTIQTAAINQMIVTGSMSGAVLQTDENYSKRLVQLASLKVTGAMTNSIIFASGNVGSISAGSYSGDRIYAGVEQTVVQNAQLPTAAAASTDYTANAKINSVVTSSPKSTFANTLISAETLGTLKLGLITTGNSGTSFGVAGTTIGSISGTLSPATKFAFSGKTLKTAAALTAYETAQKLTSTVLGDFTVVVT